MMHAANRTRIVWTLEGVKKMPPEEAKRNGIKADNKRKPKTHPAAWKAKHMQRAEQTVEKHRYFRPTLFALISPITEKLRIPFEICF
ncbi:MAG: hypothetical protein IKX15_07360 [Spirochaetales bacterium]|nr:hypothetical protein [Spirochaetales bacterium]MBR5669414.1 hypothetical protein [Spirochaetales bacterium]